MRTAVTALLFLSALAISTAHASSKMEVDGEGGYSGVVVKIADDGSVPEDKCSEILDNIRVRTKQIFSTCLDFGLQWRNFNIGMERLWKYSHLRLEKHWNMGY